MSLYRIHVYRYEGGRTERVIRLGVLLGRSGDINTGRLSALNQKDKGSKPGNLPKNNALLEIGEHWIEKNTIIIAENRVHSQFSPCGFCGAQSGTATGFSPALLFPPVSIIPPVLHTNFQIHAALTRRRLATGWTVRGSNPGENEIFRPTPDWP
jgi:hypothetical protein